MISNTSETFDLLVRSDSYPESSEPSSKPTKANGGSPASGNHKPKGKTDNATIKNHDNTEWDFDLADPDVF